MGPHLPTDPLNAAGVADGPGARARDEARTALYVHVPFCAARCAYCDFSTGAPSRARVERWLEGLGREAALRAPSAAGVAFTSLFFGGGTPSALSAHHFRGVMDMLRVHFALAPGAEVTLEANPESVRPALLEAWAGAGVNRLSIGAQSFDDAELQRLGRRHRAADVSSALAAARTAGFGRLSLDLMFGFPGHTPEGWGRTLECALELSPEHLSAYAFIPEGGTPLGNAALRGEVALPGPEVEADLYGQLTARLAAVGMGCYETSNFCLHDAESRHNLTYWLRRPYLALGPSAHGLWGGERYADHHALERWARDLDRGLAPEASREPETGASVASETLMLALRLGSGLEPADLSPGVAALLARRYGPALAAALAGGRLEGRGLAVRVPARFRFVADEVVAWIEARAEAGLTAAAGVA